MKNEKEINGSFETEVWMTLEVSMKYELPFSLLELGKDPDIKVDIDGEDGELIIEYPDGTGSYHYPTFREPSHYWNKEWEVHYEDFVSPEESSNV